MATQQQTSTLASDSIIPVSGLDKPYDSYDGRMKIYESASSTKPLEIDVVVTNLAYGISEFIQVNENIGNLCSVLPIGMGPMTLTISGLLINTGNNFGKDYFVKYYKNNLRPEAIGKTGSMPVFMLRGMAVYGAAVNLVFTETSASEDTISFALTLAITKIVMSDGNSHSASLDYFLGISGEESLPTIGTSNSSTTTSTPSVTTKK